jgi:hypothetical protein
MECRPFMFRGYLIKLWHFVSGVDGVLSLWAGSVRGLAVTSRQRR